MEDVELEYDEDDFANLTTFKLFSDNIKPLVVADQPKITGSKLSKFLQAKYREFVMQVPPMERDNYDKAGVGECATIYYVRIMYGVALCVAILKKCAWLDLSPLTHKLVV